MSLSLPSFERVVATIRVEDQVIMLPTIVKACPKILSQVLVSTSPNDWITRFKLCRSIQMKRIA